MCGIIGYIGSKIAVSVILEGLKRLEYRGYDSAGIACFSEKGIEVIRCKGKIRDLASVVEAKSLVSGCGIGHTRWATHGKPSEENAHPHRSGGIVIVHNGIIENYLPLKKKLADKGYTFVSDTDTEVLCHLIRDFAETLPLEDAVRAALKEVKGPINRCRERKDPIRLSASERQSLVVGLGDGEYFLASDVPAFLHYSRDVMFLEDGEMVVMSSDGVLVTDLEGTPVQKEVKSITWSPSMAEKGGYRHFMLKEIFEQPRAVSDTLRGRFSIEDGRVNLDEFGLTGDFLKDIKKIFIVACRNFVSMGLRKYMIEDLAGCRLRSILLQSSDTVKPHYPEHLMVVITQIRKTADTLAAQREARRLGAKTSRSAMCCTVITSAREANAVFTLHSGPEIGVHPQRHFLQVMSIYLTSVAWAGERNLVLRRQKELLEELLLMPE
jgi:glucosamine--fructose-6-phosphate aminotransferase (isomerizing)